MMDSLNTNLAPHPRYSRVANTIINIYLYKYVGNEMVYQWVSDDALPRVYKKNSCATQISMKFQMLKGIKIPRNSAFLDSDKPRMLFACLQMLKWQQLLAF